MSTDRDIRVALRRLSQATAAPSVDPGRESALLRTFDAQGRGPTPRWRTARWWLPLFAATAALVVTVALPSRTPAVRALRSPATVGEFIPWPGAADLPPLESGELVRMDLPVALLPSLGVAPPAGHVTAVKADVVIGQDGLARAVRFVAD